MYINYVKDYSADSSQAEFIDHIQKQVSIFVAFFFFHIVYLCVVNIWCFFVFLLLGSVWGTCKCFKPLCPVRHCIVYTLFFLCCSEQINDWLIDLDCHLTLLVFVNSVLIPVLEVVSWKCLNRIALTMFEHILLPVDMLTVGMNYLKLRVMLSHWAPSNVW